MLIWEDGLVLVEDGFESATTATSLELMAKEWG